MDKTELLKALAIKTGFPQVTVESVLQALAEVVKGQPEVFLRGLGKFKWTDRAERMGRNPTTGEKIKINAKRVLVFRASK